MVPNVPKGAAAQRQREANLTTQANRKVYTCVVDSTTGAPNCTAGSLSAKPFKTTTLPPDLPVRKRPSNSRPPGWRRRTRTTDIGEADRLGSEAPTISATSSAPADSATVRPTIHGDVLHSTPVALNFSTRVVVFYGTNEGMLRAVEGKQTGSGAGDELWTFVAPEFLDKLKRLRQERRGPRAAVEPRRRDDQQGRISSTGRSARTRRARPRSSTWRSGAAATSSTRSTSAIRTIRSSSSRSPIPGAGRDCRPPRARPDLVDAEGDQGARPHIGRASRADLRWRLRHCRGCRAAPGRPGAACTSSTRLTGAVLKHFLLHADWYISTSVPSEVTIVNSTAIATASSTVRTWATWPATSGAWTSTTARRSTTRTGWNACTSSPASGRAQVLLSARRGRRPGLHAVLIGSGDREKPLRRTPAIASTWSRT